jgi:eukaryotic-like serine/threonine-protein kinase
MPLSIGDKLGPYEILAAIGAGGMGEVYRARDTRLGREVAIKVSAEKFSDRFEREARAVAALNHPHICTLYDVVLSNDAPNYLVMEFIEGHPPRAPLPIDEAVKYAAHIADALDAAHAKGIIHRDIKPANVLITARGEAKVLDFGLAQFNARPSEPGSVTELMLTAAGSAVGTVAYMSPEQARGQVVDGRTDIWALGVMLYEMVTGARPFQGATQASIFDAILNRAPVAPSLLNADVPSELERAILSATEKDRTLRYQTAADLLADLRRMQRDAIASESKAAKSIASAAPTPPFATQPAIPSAGGPSSPPAARPAHRLGWYLAAAGALVLAAVAVGVFLMRPATKPPAERSDWQQLTDFTDTATDAAFSPDGRMLAFKRGGTWFLDRGQMYVKMLPDGRAVQLTHDDLPKMAPVFSPDGSRIVYSVRGPGWDTWEAPILAGGEPRRMLANAEGLRWIDPSHILFSEVRTSPSMVVVVSEESRAGMRDVYLPTQPRGMAHFSALSPNRKQVLIVEMDLAMREAWLPCRLAPFDGSSKGAQVGPVPSTCTAAAWSPDGKWMYFTADTGNGPHIWRQKNDGSPPEQISSGPTTEEGIAMAPDGRSIVSSVGTTRNSVWIHDGNGNRQISSEGDAVAPNFSPDGTRVFYLVEQTGRSERSWELWATDVNSGRAEPVLPGVSMVHYTVSPDGKAVAYITRGDAGRDGGLWYAQLDRRSPPRNLVVSGVRGIAGIGVSGNVFYTAQDGKGGHTYRIAPDGTGSGQIVQGLGMGSISPDEQWAISRGSAYPVNGGRPVVLCGAPCSFAWSPERKSVAITLRAFVMSEGVTGIIPLRGNAMLPPLLPEGIGSVDDLKKIPGSQMVPYENVSPGPAGSYAYQKNDTLRNLYRIPLP